MERKEVIKKSLTVAILNIILPTFDVYSDLSFIIYLFKDIGPYDERKYWNRYWHDKEKEQSPKYAIALLFFFLLNYLLCFLAWFRNEEKRLKTLIFPILNVYPQFCK